MNSENYTNPFDSDAHQFLVLKNTSGEYSLWPEFLDVPAGWETVHGPDAREACSSYVDTHWLSINPFVSQKAQQQTSQRVREEEAP
ncbi:MbtH family protein [Microbulbifer aggregans]|uniref:MbtH family protein n=1 Tax=Microbulbifer aggregans TaxID=1769779 RepID=UPI001CFDC5EA|nr:MbtH family protein [Microbulbifer aggregans]